MWALLFAGPCCLLLQQLDFAQAAWSMHGRERGCGAAGSFGSFAKKESRTRLLPSSRSLLLLPIEMTATNEDRSTSSSKRSSAGAPDKDNDNILEDSSGHINRDLAERIWNWEQERRSENNLPKVDYSVRSGLRLVDSTIDSILSTTATTSSGNRGGGSSNSNRQNSRSNLRGELIQEGLFALLDAMSHYREETHEEDFETYASREIYRHLAQTMEEDGRPLRLPNGVKTVVKEANRLMAKGDEDGTKLTLAQVAAKLKIPVGRLQDYLRLAKATGHALSMESTVEIYNPMLDEPTPAYRDQDEFELREGMLLDDGHSVHRNELVNEYVDKSMEREGDDEAWVLEERIAAPLQDMIVDNDELSPDDFVLEEQARSNLYALLSSTLEAEVLEVVRLYFGLDSGKALTIEEIAHQTGKEDKEVLALVEEALEMLRAAYFDSNSAEGLDSE